MEHSPSNRSVTSPFRRTDPIPTDTSATRLLSSSTVIWPAPQSNSAWSASSFSNVILPAPTLASSAPVCNSSTLRLPAPRSKEVFSKWYPSGTYRQMEPPRLPSLLLLAFEVPRISIVPPSTYPWNFRIPSASTRKQLSSDTWIFMTQPPACTCRSVMPWLSSPRTYSSIFPDLTS